MDSVYVDIFPSLLAFVERNIRLQQNATMIKTVVHHHKKKKKYFFQMYLFIFGTFSIGTLKKIKTHLQKVKILCR